jgi:hypothetical protein
LSFRRPASIGGGPDGADALLIARLAAIAPGGVR